ncbi:hypothetical protein L207DRAFT_507630 [Hyaloscypha variabilis F]|uniref:Uncharacterized protein n=1 Tax=Hyaloscypha variabilis (strain UAMH 11265 / GT02V1 / F) TaxID=1149755 RepID=A0A2J6S7J1_HYAVF|nr:hypothetical protein L207DRAFT_507630 [Hyaloscypha variabilis F]
MSIEVLDHWSAGSKKSVIMVLILAPLPRSSDLIAPLHIVSSLVRYKSHEVIRHIFTDYLLKATSSGAFRPTPEPQIFSHGLEKIQEALDLCRREAALLKS